MQGRTVLLLLTGAVGIPVAGSAQGKSGVAVTPFLGLTVPGRDLLLRPGLAAGRDQEKQGLIGVFGGRLSIGLTEQLEVEADVAYGSSGLKLSTLSSPSGTDAAVLAMSGRLAFRLKPTIEPFWLTLNGGVAAISRTFSGRSGQPAGIHDATNVGAVIGTTLGFRLGSRSAFVVGIDDFIYNASFDVDAAGTAPAGKTQSLTQNDIRLSLGLRFAVAGL